MTEQPQPAIGTVAEEAARLIEAMATMAGSSSSRSPSPSSSPYAGGPAAEPAPSGAPDDTRPAEHPKDGQAALCSACGGAQDDDTPVACRLCPLCQGIALLRSVRPETVDRLADLVSAMAASLRDVATQSRASGPTPSTARPASGRPSDRTTVQDIPVDEGYEG